MAFDGSGTYSLSYTWATEAASPPIAISKLDTEMAGIATGLSTAILRNGNGKPTADIDWNAKKITNLADAAAATDAMNRQASDARYLAKSGGTLTGGLTGTTGTFSSTLDVTGAVTMGSTLGLTGNLAINTNKFNVTAASGNTTIAGTLGVTGAITGASFAGSVSGAVAATTLSASSTVSGTGFTNYFASPPALGTTAPAGVKATFAHTDPVAVTFNATTMTVDCALSNVFTTTFTANVTSAPTLSNAKDGQTINWFITQDATGSRTMTWPTSFKWPGGVAGTLSTAANAVDLLVATYRSSTGFWYCTLSKGFA